MAIYFHVVVGEDRYGTLTIIPVPMLTFSPRELLKTEGSLTTFNIKYRRFPTRTFAFQDHPCLPQRFTGKPNAAPRILAPKISPKGKFRNKNWYKSQPGESQRPLTASRKPIRQRSPLFKKNCEGRFLRTSTRQRYRPSQQHQLLSLLKLLLQHWSQVLLRMTEPEKPPTMKHHQLT